MSGGLIRLRGAISAAIFPGVSLFASGAPMVPRRPQLIIPRFSLPPEAFNFWRPPGDPHFLKESGGPKFRG